MLTKLDAWVLFRVFDPLLQKMGRWWGVTAGGAARICAIAVAVLYTMDAALNVGLTKWFLLIFIAGMVFQLYQSSEQADKWPNDNIITLWFGRLWGLLFIVLDTVIDITLTEIDLWEIGWLAWVCGLYFASCPPPPPKEQKVKLATQTV